MRDFRKIVIEEQEDRLEVTDAVFALIKIFLHPLFEGDRQFELMRAYSARVVTGGPAEIGGQFGDDGKDVLWAEKAEQEFMQKTGAPRGSRVTSGFTSDAGISRQLHQFAMKEIDLTLTEPVSVIRDLRFFHTRMSKQAPNIYLRIPFINKIAIGIEDPAVVERCIG